MHGTYLPRKPHRVLVLGSGALKIGQAGEFDYSGSQAIKALREEGIFTVLINPNIATIQTSIDFADRVYLLAVIPEFVEQVIKDENIDAILLSCGGQTALNCGLKLHEQGVFDKYGVHVLGTPVSTIRDTEDRDLFVRRLKEIDVHTAASKACYSVEEAVEQAHGIGLPVMLRNAFSLGGRGSCIVDNEADLQASLRRAFASGTQQVLVEECLRGWKEIEYEVVRDAQDNCITVCNMENLDPMGIHTGESIVVAPSQTLDNTEYQHLRSIAIRTIRHLGIIGECNIQYALNPEGTDYRVIEVNARLSRSSALASKATGYPLAYVATKLAIGHTLAEIPNGINGATTAFFEPSLDYIVCKIPRWDLGKFHGAAMTIGSEMKSVGEVMAIGRTFPEVIQKALRMLDIGVTGLDPAAFDFEDIHHALRNATPTRIFAIAKALYDGLSAEEIHGLTHVDRWFIHAIEPVVSEYKRLSSHNGSLSASALRNSKVLGFSDRAIAKLVNSEEEHIRSLRLKNGITPHLAQIDTLAAEFPADTNYLYLTYHADADDVGPSQKKKIIVLGSGAYRIGSSVEFDWCCVNAVQAARENGYETIMVNFNPETVSTDYEVCDKLVFDEISPEIILGLYERENPAGVIVSMGGQIANNIAIQLHEAGVRILGTSPENIDRAENRSKFSAMLDELGIDQPRWAEAADMANIDHLIAELGGYPVLVRPSYVLSGAAMSVAHEESELRGILARAVEISPAHPVVVSKFETHAREVEIDAVADRGKLAIWAISEHIEDAGVHSGDATLVLPPQTLYIPTIRRIRQIASTLAKALDITGPFNMQFLAKRNAVKVIECNLRASRSLPFVSKTTGVNYAHEAMRCILGIPCTLNNNYLDLDHVGVKVPMFSFARVEGADPFPGVEMASTGEVGCLGGDLHEALLHGLLATRFHFPEKGILLSLGPMADKYWFAEEASVISEELQLPVYATQGTSEMLAELGIPSTAVGKSLDGETSFARLIDADQIDLVINIPRTYDEFGRPDGYLIRRYAIDAGIPLITDLQLARAIIEALRRKKFNDLSVLPMNVYLTKS